MVTEIIKLISRSKALKTDANISNVFHKEKESSETNMPAKDLQKINKLQ